MKRATRVVSRGMNAARRVALMRASGIACLALCACGSPHVAHDATVIGDDAAGTDVATADAALDSYAGTGNRFGIGLVSPGSTLDWDLAADLAGPGGSVLLVFAGITRDTQGPDPAWIEAVQQVYARGLVPVVRLGPPWGNEVVRDDSDDAAHAHYTALAAAYRRVVEALPRDPHLPLWIEVHNEPDLCYEWACSAGEGQGGYLPYQTTAHEYAAMLRDVADALHAIGDPRILVMNAGLAPGGAARCQCGGTDFSPGITSRDFLAEMEVAVPDVFAHVDGFASHAYPAQGEGWGFFVPYEQAGPGLTYFARELDVVGRTLPVFLTETGWTTSDGSNSRAQIAGWTVRAYQEVWLVDPRIVAVMPFQLRDPAWDAFGWVAPDGSHYPVYDAVRALRCQTIAGRCP